jgi:Spy/CpxP family protein refolding chaperone
MMARQLDLNEDQIQAIQEIHEKTKDQGLALRKELMRLKNDLRGEMLKDDPSEKTVLSLNEKMGELKTQLKANRLKARLEVREQLTPQQQDKMLLLGDGPGRLGRDKGRHFPDRGFGRGQGGQGGPRDGSGPRGQLENPADDQ